MHLLSLFLTLSPLTAQGGTLPSYRVDFLGPNTSASALNESGVTVGWVALAGGQTVAAVSYDGEPLADNPLPLPPGHVDSWALDINEAGLIVGSVRNSSAQQAAAWHPGPGGYTVQLLGIPPGDWFSVATGVNDLGDVVGGSGTLFSPNKALLFTASGPVVLPTISHATDVNNNRQVLAGNRLLDLDTLQVQTIPLPPGSWYGVVSAAINELDAFVGSINGTSSTCPNFPVRWQPGTGWTFVGGCANTTSATAINDLGDVLHYVYPTIARVRLEGLGDYAIGQLIDPSQGNWWVQYWGAADINNARQILCGVKDPTQTMLGAARLTDLNACGSSTVALYCTAKTSSSGCVPAVTTQGEPSASAGSGFFVRASQIEAGKIGLLFYGKQGPAAIPFQDGYLCVAQSVLRLPAQSSNGTTTCTGAFDYDFNAWIASGFDPGLGAGSRVNAQFWFRDPAAASTTGLSGGVEFVVCP
jgi:hypothetical protein